MLSQPVTQHPASVDAYIRHGWSLVPIPQGTKGPKTPNWNQRTAALRSQSDLPPGWGIGLAHAYSGTMALDIDAWDAAQLVLKRHGVDLLALYNAPDAVVIDSGRQGHGKLLYAMPFGLALPSKKIIEQGQTIYELRCATTNGLTVQDVLPPSIHPETMQPYRWAGRGHWTRTPPIPDALLTLWQSLLESDKTRTIATDTPISASWDEIQSALYAISPDCSRDEWITCGMALHYAGTQTAQIEQAAHIWDQWSQGSPKYPGEREMAAQWRSFNTTKATMVKLGSLFHLARQAGWQRPQPDTSSLFSAVDTPKSPIQVTTDLRPAPPDLDLDLIPPILRRRAQEVSVSIGCDPLVPLFAGIATVAGAMDARSRLELAPGFKVPPVLWVMTIGDPADKKSPGSVPMFEVLHAVEAEDRPNYARRKLDYEVQQAIYETAHKAHIDWAKSSDGLMAGNTVGPAVPSEPQEPHPLKIVVQDITSQKLVRRAAQQPRGLLCHLDEMASWAKKITDPRSGEDRSSWTVAYESRWYEMDRVTAGTILAENFAVTIYGNMQPHVLRANYDGLSSDGLLQRFIPVPLRHSKSRLSEPIPEHLTNVQEYEMLVRSVYALPPMTYRLSPDAYRAFREFQVWYESAKTDERVLRSSVQFMTTFGKLEGLVGRLVLVWHAMTDPYSLTVPVSTVNDVIRLVRSYLVPVLRYVHNGDLSNISDSFDIWLAEYVMQYSDTPMITLSQVKRSARRKVEGMSSWSANEMILSAMHTLEQAKWVMRLDDGTREHQGHGEWAVNPALLETFKDQRRAIIEAKQRRMDEIYRDNPKDTEHRVYGYEPDSDEGV